MRKSDSLVGMVVLAGVFAAALLVSLQVWAAFSG